MARRPPRLWDSAKTVWRSLDVVADPLEPVLAGADAVVHLAWLIQPSRDRAQTRAVNVGGSRRVMQAVAAAGVPALVYASSVGAYSPGPKDRRVDETWPTGGVPSSFYSRDKAEVERLLDAFERDHPERARRAPAPRPHLPARRGIGDPAPVRRALPAQPARGRRSGSRSCRAIRGCASRPSHADDVADAYRRAIVGDARGAFNVAAEPILDGEALGRPAGRPPGPVPRARAARRRRRRPSTCGSPRRRRAGSTWRSPSRSWTPRGRARCSAGSRGATPARPCSSCWTASGPRPAPRRRRLQPGGDGPLRSREILSGVGARGPR